MVLLRYALIIMGFLITSAGETQASSRSNARWSSTSQAPIRNPPARQHDKLAAKRIDNLMVVTNLFPWLPFEDIVAIELDMYFLDIELNKEKERILKRFFLNRPSMKDEQAQQAADLLLHNKLQLCQIASQQVEIFKEVIRRSDSSLDGIRLESCVERLAQDSSLRDMLSHWGRLEIMMDNYRSETSKDLFKMTIPGDKEPITLECFECTDLRVRNPKNMGVFKIKAEMSFFESRGHWRHLNDMFKGVYDISDGGPLLLSSKFYTIQIDFNDHLSPYLQDNTRFRTVLASVLHDRDSCKEPLGAFFLNVMRNYSRAPNLALAGGLPQLYKYISWDESSCLNPDEAYQNGIALSKMMSYYSRRFDYGSSEWSDAMEGIALYEQIRDNKPIEYGLLQKIFPPPPLVFHLFEHNKSYGEEYEHRLRHFLRTGTPELWAYLNNISFYNKYYEYNAREDHPYPQQLVEHTLSFMKRSDVKDATAAFITTFHVRPEHIAGLDLLRAIGCQFCLVPPKTEWTQFYRETLPERICEAYENLAETPFVPELPSNMQRAFLKHGLRRVFAPQVSSLGQVQAELKRELSQVEQFFKDFPFLQTQKNRTEASSHLLSSAPLRVFFENLLQKHCQKMSPKFPALAGNSQGVEDLYHRRALESDLAYEEALVRRLMQNPGKTPEQVIEEYSRELHDQYQEILEKKWLSPTQCEQYVYDTEVACRDQVQVLSDLLSVDTDIIIFLSLNLDFRGPEANESLEKDFYQGLARRLLSPGNRLTLQQAHWAHYATWVRRCFDLIPVLLADDMKDRVTEKVLAGQEMVTAVAEEVPSLYEASLGPVMVLKDPDTCTNVAQALLCGHSFLDCHGLKKSVLSKQTWFQAIIELKSIPLNEYDLAHPKGGQIPPFEDLMATFAATLVTTDEAELWKMPPFEVICGLRKANKLISKTSYLQAQQHEQLLADKRQAAQERREQQLKARADLEAQFGYLESWDQDGRNMKYHNEAVVKLAYYKRPMNRRERMAEYTTYGPDDKGITFSLKVDQLRQEPWLKKPQLELDVPNDISDELYEQMQDVLCCVARDRIFSMRVNLPLHEGGYAQTSAQVADEACWKVRQFFRMALTNVQDYKNDNPVIPDQHYRKRIFRVYDRLFRPLIDNEAYDQAFGELEVLMAYAIDCIDAARLGLLVLEQHPSVQALEQAPNLFERLAYVLRDFRLSIISEIARDHARYCAIKDPVGFDVVMRNAFNIALSLGLEDCDQYYLDYMKYTTASLGSDVSTFILKYKQGLLRAVMQAIQDRAMPTGDKNPGKLYIEEIADWADKSTYYCNSTELDKDLMDGPSIRPQAVANLLEAAGYIEQIDGRFF